MLTAPLYRFGAERILQTLAITATGSDLDRIGNNYGVVRKPAEAAEFTITLPATTGTIIPLNTNFVGDANGLRYFSNTAATAAAGIATILVTAQEVGSSGNLDPGDTLTISTQIPGAETVATIITVDNTGADEESDESYRSRVLSVIRTQGGGGNAADYRTWSEEVAGVKRAYPYSGDPENTADPPPARTVYVESEDSIDPDGIAPQSLLDEVRVSITTDPLTGESRQPLGLTDDTLYIRSISRKSIFFEIRNLEVNASIEAQVKTDIETALEEYCRSLTPFLPALDAEFDRVDTITDPSASEVVQNVVKANGGTVEAVAFGEVAGSTIPAYTLNAGELAKSGGVTYV